MPTDQNALGNRITYRLPTYNQLKMARVTSTRDFQKFGKIEAVFLDYSQPAPIWVINDLDREPVSGDFILVGFMEGRRDMPYMAGFVKNRNYTTNFITVSKDKIKLQLPIFEIGVKNGKSHKDTEGNLLDNSKQGERATIELTPEQALISFPTSENGSTPPAVIRITADAVTVTHPNQVRVNGGTKGVARVGDRVDLDIYSSTYGQIVSGSTKLVTD